jgi:hypothetical protein
VAGGMLLVGAAAPARAERFTSMQYLGGCSTKHRQSGVLVLEGGELRFEDRKGRVVCTLALRGAQARLAEEKRTTFGSILRSTALTMVAIPLSSGQIDPTQAWSRDTTPILVVEAGQGANTTTVRWRGPRQQLAGIAEAINRRAQESTLPPVAASLAARHGAVDSAE